MTAGGVPLYTACLTPCMGRKPQIQSRVDNRTQERIESFREQHDLSQSDAVRQLVRAGLDQEEQNKLTGMARQTGLLEGLKLIATAAAAYVGAGGLF